MSENLKMTVTLHWRDGGSEREEQLTCADQTPQQLIPKLAQKIGLPDADNHDDIISYELRLGGEQRPPLKPKELLSNQNVRYGSDLWLVPQIHQHDGPLPRCILRLPDGCEIVVPSGGQELRRSWLTAFMELLNPNRFEHEIERFERRQSPYCFVSDRNVHCVIQVAERGAYWVVTTERDDVLTECATEHEFDRIPVGAPIRLDNGMRLRLGGPQGLVLDITIV
jgi:hypothetical protein